MANLGRHSGVPTGTAQHQGHFPGTAMTGATYRPGRPLPGGTLTWWRSAVLVVRVVLVLAAVVLVAQSSIWLDGPQPGLVAGAVLFALLPLGGLIWWVEPQVPWSARGREAARVRGRRVRAVLGSLALLFLLLLPQFGVGWVWFFVVGFLLIVPALLSYPMVLGQHSTRDEVEVLTSIEQQRFDRRRGEALATVDAERVVLVEATGWPRPGDPETIRPHTPADGPPPRTRSWSKHGTLSTDGRQLTATDRRGRTHTVPLGGPNGAAALLALRHSVRTMTHRGRSLPQLREYLCVLDPAGRRLLDMPLYGFTRSDLGAFASVAGLRLERYQPAGHQVAVPGMFGLARADTVFDLAHPRVPNHRMLRESTLWWAILGGFAAFVVVAGVFLALGYFVSPIAASIGTLAAVLGLGVAVSRRRGARPHPPDAI